MTIDPRKDSGEMPAVDTPARNISLEILLKLEKLANDNLETRSTLKEVLIATSELKTSHGDHRKSLDTLAATVLEMKGEVADVRKIAERADANATGAHRKISETQSGLTMTLEGVKAGQNGLAAKTFDIAKETTAQTATLARQSAQIDVATSLLENAKKHLPALLAAATIAGTLLGKFLDALISTVHR